MIKTKFLLPCTQKYAILHAKIAFAIKKGRYFYMKQSKRISVIGCGRWGSLIAWYLDRMGHEVMLYGRASSRDMIRFRTERKNDYLTLPESIALTSSLDEALSAEITVISVGSQQLRGLMEEMQAYPQTDRIFVLCMKGIEVSTGKRLSQVVAEFRTERTAVWLGPGHVQDFYAGQPNCMVIDSADKDTRDALVGLFSSDLIRFYYGTDLIGNEIGAAAKNVIGIAAGMLDGSGYPSLKGALMARAPAEISRLIVALGGKERTAYGLCHLGDYEATLFSAHSHNRRFGECFIKGETFDRLAEGYYTVDALLRLGARYDVELPICNAVYRILYLGADPKTEMDALFARALKREF